MSKAFLFLLLFVYAMTFGQTKIEGIGKFKLNKTTTAFIDTLVKEQNLDRTTVSSFEESFDLRYKSNKIAEVFPDTVKTYNSPSWSHLCKDVRVFYIPKIKIAEIDINNMYLTFYKDTLIEIHTDWKSDISDAFELKYGKGELEKKEKEVKCTLKLTGGTLTYIETMFYQYWYNGNIKCTVALGDYYDSKCEKQTLSYISVTIDKMVELIRNCDNSIRERIKDKENAEKKKKLDEF